MKTRKLALFRAILSIVLVITVLWPIRVGTSLLVVVESITGFPISFLLLRKDESIRSDERIKLINEKSATATLSTYILGITLVGTVLLALDNCGGYVGLSSSAYALLYSACGVLILNVVFGI
jgi:uncharacterized membrane protein